MSYEDEKEKAKKLANFLKIFAKKLVEHPEILADLELAAEDIPNIRQKRDRGKKISVDFDIYEIFSNGGESVLREKLDSLDIEILRQIIGQNSLDSSKLSRKWRKKERLINLIVEKVLVRSEKGHAFKSVK